MNISIVAKTTFAIIAVVALVAMAGAVGTGASNLLNAAITIVVLVVVGNIVIAINQVPASPEEVRHDGQSALYDPHDRRGAAQLQRVT